MTWGSGIVWGSNIVWTNPNSWAGGILWGSDAIGATSDEGIVWEAPAQMPARRSGKT